MATEEQCRRALKVHRNQLLELANVTGLGVRKLEKPHKAAGQLCLAVYVSAKKPRDQLSPKDVIPWHVVLDGDEYGTTVSVPTGVFEIGELEIR